jgi:hypothetical protein
MEFWVGFQRREAARVDDEWRNWPAEEKMNAKLRSMCRNGETSKPLELAGRAIAEPLSDGVRCSTALRR